MARLEKLLVLAILVFLPSQLAFHWWPSWSLVSGVRVDYLSPTLYFTDLIIIFLLLLAFINKKLWLPTWLLIVVVAAVINIYFAEIRPLAIYYWLRFSELLLFGLYIRRTSKLLLGAGLAVGLVWSSVLALWQFSAQSSINGWWRFLGERHFDLTTPGIAKVVLPSGQYLLRAYATLPHPNALAGYLVIGSALVYYLYPILWRKIKYLWALVVLAIVASWSRSGIIAGFSILILNFKNRYLKMAILTLLIAAFFLPANPTSGVERLQLMKVAINVAAAHPWFGVGLGNFIPTAHYGFQPVHNIFLLLLTELGTTLFLPVLIISVMLFTKADKPLKIIFMATIILGLVDHYWLTLHQTQIILTILLAQVGLKSRPS